jgi:hypothetical protein
MKVNVGALAGVLLIVSSGTAEGQVEKPLASPSVDNGKAVQAKEKSDQIKMHLEYAKRLSSLSEIQANRELYEDIEIMRRILDRAFTGLPGPTGTVHAVTSAAFTPDGKVLASTHDGEVRMWGFTQSCPFVGRDRNTVNCAACHANFLGQLELDFTSRGRPESAAPHGVEGVYLKDYGVVFSVTLPVERVEAVAGGGATKPQRPVPSEWERARSELHGEKINVEERKAPPEPPSLADTIIKALAENGHYFSGLGDNERLTVAITLRPAGRGAKSGETTSWLTNPGMAGPRGTTAAASPYSATQFNLTGIVGAELTPEKDEAGGWRQSANNYAHLGEMRLKQGRIREAVEAYEKATALYQKVVESINADRGDERWKEKMAAAAVAADALVRLAQAHLLQGNTDRAHQLIDRSAELAGWASSGKGEGGKAKTSSESSKATLPARLIISAPKQLLDQVGAGKITFDAFKKVADIQYLSF